MHVWLIVFTQTFTNIIKRKQNLKQSRHISDVESSLIELPSYWSVNSNLKVVMVLKFSSLLTLTQPQDTVQTAFYSGYCMKSIIPYNDLYFTSYPIHINDVEWPIFVGVTWGTRPSAGRNSVGDGLLCITKKPLNRALGQGTPLLNIYAPVSPAINNTVIDGEKTLRQLGDSLFKSRIAWRNKKKLLCLTYPEHHIRKRERERRHAIH